MLHGELLALWHFDETDGPVAANAVHDGAPMLVHGAVFQPRRFGGALVLRRRYDYARGPAMPALRAAAVSFWLRIDARPRAAEILDINGTCSILVDAHATTGVVAQVGECTLPSGKQLTIGHWHHIALTCNPDGATLYLDGQVAIHDPQAKGGLTAGTGRDERIAIGALGDQFTPFAIDELAVFSTCLDAQRITQLAMGELDQSAPLRPQVQPRSVHARDYIDRADPTCGLQRAIDATGPAGGTVTIPAGRFVLRQPLTLSSGVTLCGDGGQTMLIAPPLAVSTLAAHCPRGSTSVRVDDPSAFAVGDAVTVRSDLQPQYRATCAAIVAIEGATLRLSKPLYADCMTFDRALVVNWCPMLTAVRQHGVRVCDLRIEGPRESVDDVADPVSLPCAAIHLLDAVDCAIERCRVTAWPHHGVVLHGGGRVRVDHCDVIDCLGHGIHLDGEARLLHVEANTTESNRLDGVHVGELVRDSVIAGNMLTGNGGFGIGGLNHPDAGTILVSANHCLHNRLGAIHHSGVGQAVHGNLTEPPPASPRLTRRMF
jgi:hypothetical protein